METPDSILNIHLFPHNNLWHEDALKYKYTFPWSEGYDEGHNGYNSDRSSDSDDPAIPETRGIPHNNLWQDDTLGMGMTECGYTDFTDSAASGSSALGKNCPTSRVSKKDKKDQKNEGESSNDDTIVVSDADHEQLVDLTNDSDGESRNTVMETPNQNNAEKRNPKRKRPSSNESPEKNCIDTAGIRPPVSKKQRVKCSQGLVCDYCGHVVIYRSNQQNHEAAEVMKCHFTDKKHNSASLAKILMSGKHTGIAEAILREGILMTCRDKHVALVNKVVPMCPKKGCNQVHETIWACAKHYEMCHFRQSTNIYGLAKVVSYRTIMFPTTDVCRKCALSFPSASAVHKHWENTGCLKGNTPNKKGEVKLYFCPYCSLLHFNFGDCRMHIKYKHMINGDASMHVIVIEATTNQLELLPVEPRSAEAQAFFERTVLKAMRKSAKMYGFGSKPSKRKLKAEQERYEGKPSEMNGNTKADKDYAAFQKHL
ncbi:uncharacterized protein LOC117323454 [Pecten maximus]|uniref:uncharacterized protein LOC117323454 n=1 Tax=Pecten maximus TaxID=6579 RepID=UPI001458F8BC|nr:uncharacterized protein LOC117323454 [Pecten maximus]XP_033734578.1 uncharacterized protein LOC117323454 [Pecten maximus]